MLYVAGLWRYPVKSLAGEALTTALVRPDGIAGDRIVRVRGPEGVRTSRRQYRMLGLHGTLDPGNRALINGFPWDSLEALALVKRAAGLDASLEPWNDLDRFDILPLLFATDGAVTAFGRDVRRLRPNILIGGVDGLSERAWPGRELHVGDVIVRLGPLRQRCHMTTIDPDTLEIDPTVLRDIVRRFDNRLALNAEVVRAGTIRIGDPVSLLPSDTRLAPANVLNSVQAEQSGVRSGEVPLARSHVLTTRGETTCQDGVGEIRSSSRADRRAEPGR